MLLALLGMALGPSDEELVRRFTGGDESAFSALVERYQDRIYTLCLRWLRDRQVSEEVAQDVFIAVYRALPRFRGDARFSTWLFRIAVNHCKNKRQYQHRRQRNLHEPLEGEPREDRPDRQLPSLDPGTDRSVHVSDAEDLLRKGLAELDEGYRAIVVLRDIQGLAYEEIADILDLPRGTVKSRLHRARAQLARSLSRFAGREDIFE